MRGDRTALELIGDLVFKAKKLSSMTQMILIGPDEARDSREPDGSKIDGLEVIEEELDTALGDLEHLVPGE